MKRTIALMVCTATLLCLPFGAAQAGGGRYYGGARVVVSPGYYGGWYGGGYRPGYWGGVGVGVTIGAPLYYPYRYGPYYDGGWVANPAPMVYAQPVPPAAPMAPVPSIAPRNGQSVEQTEVDRRECDRWALSQPAAMADAQVFHRITLACMDARGYTAR